MRQAWSYLGPLLLFAGAWLVLPDPHPELGTAVALGIALGGAALALLGILLARQLVVVAGIVATVAVTFPVELPLAWLGPPLHVLGAVLSLEGARVRELETQLPPVRAWGLPLGLAVLASLVPLAALLTEVGRESLDISQGMGLGVSAPFLLLGIWLVVRALGTRSTSQSTAARTGATALLLVALLVATVPMAAEATHGTADRGSWEDVNIQRQFQVDVNRSVNVTADDWALNSSNVLLVDPRLPEEPIHNWTFQGGTLTIPLDAGSLLGCQDTTFTVSRLNGTWTPETLLDDVPDGLDPKTATWGQTQCAAGAPLEVNVTDHFQAWADGAGSHGWQVAKTTGSTERSGTGSLDTTVVYDRNPPRIQGITTTPDPHPRLEDEDEEVVMVPVGQPFQVNASIEEKHLLRNASVDVGNNQVLNESVTGNESVNLTMVLDAATANGTLHLRVDDWDGYWHHRAGPALLPDEEVPTLAPNTTLPVQADGDTWRLPADSALPEGEDASLPIDAADDACSIVVDCMIVVARDANGTELANFTGQGTHEVPLPTDRPGPHLIILETRDAADRMRTTGFFYNVSEDRDPTIQAVSVTGFGGRADEQEAGLPLTVNVTAEDESPPLSVRVLLEDQELNQTVIPTGQGTAELSVTLDQPGNHTLTIEVEDRWENNATTTREVEIKPDLAPVIQLPDRDHLRPEATVQARVLDSTVEEEDVTVELFAGGQPLSGAETSRTQRIDGVALRITLPFLLHGEDLRLVVTATDASGKSTTAQADYTADAKAPTIQVDPSIGQRIGTNLWTTQDAVLLLSATDPDSGVVRFDMTAPLQRALDPASAVLNVSEVGTEGIVLESEDLVGNEATWTGQLRIDEAAPRVNVTIDGHDLVVDIEEEESGLKEVRVEQDGRPLTIPALNGTHRTTLQDVRRGDVINVTVNATDRVLQTTAWSGNLTVGDAPPEVTFLTDQGRSLRLLLDDADGDEVTTAITARHAVTGNETTLELSGGNLTLPDWRGDVDVTVEATSFEKTVTETHRVILGQAPFLHASLPTEVRPDTPVTIPVGWERAFTSIDLVVERDGVRVAILDVDETEPGQGTVELELDEAGSYSLSLTAQHEDGTVHTASAGDLQVQTGTSALVVVVGVLLIILIAGTVALDRVIRNRDDEVEG